MKLKMILCIILLSFNSNIFSQAENAFYIWAHNESSVRNEYVYFRNVFVIDSEINSAAIHLYADSRYQVFVNEVFLGFGPARSYPRNPEYDTYDIKKYLKKGDNIIAVKALYNGIENFQIPENRPGFIAWGKIETNNRQIMLDTPGNWRCRISAGYDKNAVRFSFATGAMEVYDSRKEDYLFNSLQGDDSQWSSAVKINDQNSWGPLQARSIPHLTKNQYSAKSIVSVYMYNNEEEIYQYRIKTPDEKRSDYYPQRQCLAYTYIHSPKEQEVEVGLWWGEYFLNGKGPLKGLGEDSKRPNRDPRILKLNKGWNFFNFYYGAIWGAWDFYMAIPKSAGLTLSPRKVFNSDVVFMTSGPHDSDKNKFIAENKKGFNSSEDFTEYYDVKWESRRRGEKTNNPALDMVWNLSEKKVDHPHWMSEDIEIDNEQGTALTFDMGRKMLGKYFIEFEAPRNTIIDLGISEDLNHGKAWLFKRKMISAASRFICDGIRTSFETFKPYGLRYLQVNISNNSGPVVIKKVGVVEQVYPYEKIGSFECSDPILNSIWELGWRTVRVCSEDSYTDTPFRERGLYAGDMLPEYAITLAGSGDSRLLKRSLKVFYDKYHDVMFGDEIPKAADFPLINIISTKWYYDYTGDTELIQSLYPGYKSLLLKWIKTADENGIMFMGRQFIEWTRIDKLSKLTATHALLSECFGIMSELAAALNNSQDVEEFKKYQIKIKNLVEEKFWDQEKELFNDGFMNGELAGKYYPTSNAWPLLFGCINEQQKNRIINYLEMQLNDIGEESRNRRITPYSSFYAIAALYQNGRADIAEKFIKKYWTRMILNGDDTSWENFDIRSENNGGGQGTASHAWSGHPTYFLTSEVLGVNLGFHKKIGKNKIIISPQSEILSWAQGSIPHPLGVIKIDWRIEGNNLFVNYEVPENAPVEVIPRGKLDNYTLWTNGIPSSKK